MRYWVFTVEGYEGVELGSGWMRAESLDHARALCPHPELTLYPIPDDSGFPPEAVGPIWWERRSPSLTH